MFHQGITVMHTDKLFAMYSTDCPENILTDIRKTVKNYREKALSSQI